MQKWQIIYSSVTGNTKQIAEAMAAALPEGQAELLTAKEALERTELDGEVIAVGYWVTRGGPDPVTQQLLPRLANKNIVFFQTHGTTLGSEHSITSFARASAKLGPDCFILGTFASQGRINPALIEKRMRNIDDVNDPHRPTPEKIAQWQKTAQHPNEADCSQAKDFVTAMVRKQNLLAAFKAKKAMAAQKGE